MKLKELQNKINLEIGIADDKLYEEYKYKERLKVFSQICFGLFIIFSICVTFALIVYDWFLAVIVFSFCLIVCGFIYCSILRNANAGKEFSQLKEKMKTCKYENILDGSMGECDNEKKDC